MVVKSYLCSSVSKKELNNITNMSKDMKRKYASPQSVTVMMKPQRDMAAGSVRGTKGVNGLGYDGYTDGRVTSGNSRRGSYWEDED